MLATSQKILDIYDEDSLVLSGVETCRDVIVQEDGNRNETFAIIDEDEDGGENNMPRTTSSKDFAAVSIPVKGVVPKMKKLSPESKACNTDFVSFGRRENKIENEDPETCC